MGRILIVDDDFAICRTLQMHLQNEGHEACYRHSVEEGLTALNAFDPELLLIDLRLGDLSGLDGLPLFRQAHPRMRLIMMTAHHDMESTIAAMQRGADEYLHKPLDLDELDKAVTKSLGYRQPPSRTVGLAIPAQVSSSLVGGGTAMRDIFKTIGLVANTQASILITGESGTGKERVACAIHQASQCRHGPFIAVNCAALVDSLIESEMFGHKKGAFTGAVSDQPGKFTVAQGGTLFLDEIGELSPAVQAKLLRVLQEKEYSMLGGRETLRADCRIIAATNVDLPQAVRDKRFREDLFYRLQVINIPLPPLRERQEDLPALVQYLVSRANRELGRHITSVSAEAMQALAQHPWPGNIRELENLLTKAVALCQGEVLGLEQLPTLAGGCNESRDPITTTGPLSLQELERRHVVQTLIGTGWHRGQACEILGVSRPRLQRLIVQYGLEEAKLV